MVATVLLGRRRRDTLADDAKAAVQRHFEAIEKLV
jgi:hypothetical protein